MTAALVRMPIGAAAGIELTEIPDVARPGERFTVRVARRSDPLLSILDIRRDGPERAWFAAAEQFRTDSALADGAPGGSSILARLGLAHIAPGPLEPAERRLAAQQRVRRTGGLLSGYAIGATLEDGGGRQWMVMRSIGLVLQGPPRLCERRWTTVDNSH